jgi:drug/metabolite transporter (DMT)-like permease
VATSEQLVQHASKLRVRLVYGGLCLIWGTTWLAIRVLVQEVPPLRAAAIRFVIGAFVLAPLVLWRRPALPHSRREWRALFILGITAQAMQFGLLFWAEQFVSSSMTAVIFSATPLTVALLTPWLTGKSVPRGAILSLLVAMGGIAYLFQIDLRATPQTFTGGLLILGAVLSSAFTSVFAKKEVSGVDPSLATGVQLMVGAAILSTLSAAVESGKSSEWTTRSIGALLFLAVFGSAIAYAGYYWLLRHVPAYKASTIALVVPFIAILEGALILREMITLHMFTASVVVLGAVAVALFARSDEPAELRLSGPRAP